MKRLLPGQPVLQPHHDDATNPVPSGTTGRVHAYDPATGTVVIDWDNGERQHLSADAVLPLADGGGTASSAGGLDGEQILTAVRAAGEAAGRDAAGWWCQDTIGGRATGDVKPRARAILQALDDDDPELLDGLPCADPGRLDELEDLDDTGLAAILADSEGREALVAGGRDELVDAYQAGFDEALQAVIAEQCRIVLSPTGDGRDLSHLHPKDIRLGRYGVFSGEWHLTCDDGPDRYQVGYAGILTGSWNGWAVFTCTRAVAEQIVAEQAAQRDAERAALQAAGMRRRADLNREIDQRWARLWFDGDVLVVDERGQQRDSHAITRTAADLDGQYTVLGGDWCWDAVDPMNCDQIIGELPAAGQEQAWTLLRHTPGLRVPHDRLRVTDVQRRTTHNGEAFTGLLTLDSRFAGTVQQDGNGGPTEMYSPDNLFGWRGMTAYLAGSRLNDQPIGEDRLLDALVAEAELGQHVSRLATGSTVARLIDDAGHTRELRPVAPSPRDFTELPALNATLAADPASETPGTRWEMWTGSRWLDLRTFAARPVGSVGSQVRHG
jgi:hypothetical protein